MVLSKSDRQDLERSLEGTKWEEKNMSAEQLRIRKAYRVKIRNIYRVRTW